MSGPSVSLHASRSNLVIGIDFGMQIPQQDLGPRIPEFALTCNEGTTCSSIGYVHMSEVSCLGLGDRNWKDPDNLSARRVKNC